MDTPRWLFVKTDLIKGCGSEPPPCVHPPVTTADQRGDR
ncbi:hypothetical protein APASM_1557 [Actinosynnema pretiosum subsp. pretiosum]|nr:hypothetical protein APASM_1557 [Actinosynnema pretiosum subsp. pretiosum]